ncbi:uncharacterized protein LOC131932650 [Physella acuta]|uniref:uncharacterized protein LOC131932650 n=1 Tax=Physella acuta TaxID=109671 RepID=UPI0027DE8EFB|nr:uncharacterized protein LOC131932650 [Physella acuta]
MVKCFFRYSNRRQIKIYLSLLTLCSVTLFLPRPAWLTCSPDLLTETPLSVMDSSSNTPEPLRFTVIDPAQRGVAKMFDIYKESQIEIQQSLTALKLSRHDIDDHVPEVVPKLKILPSTIPKLPPHLLSKYYYAQQKEKSDDKTYRLRYVPECVHFDGPRQMTSPKICIHPPENDTVISMTLRKLGHWERERLVEMEWALQTYPDMQLVDLGCNIGVYTVYAAGMGRHVIAVDALLANLQLLQTTLTLNDIENKNYVVKGNSSDMYLSNDVLNANLVAKITNKSTNNYVKYSENSYRNLQKSKSNYTNLQNNSARNRNIQNGSSSFTNASHRDNGKGRLKVEYRDKREINTVVQGIQNGEVPVKIQKAFKKSKRRKRRVSRKLLQTNTLKSEKDISNHNVNFSNNSANPKFVDRKLTKTSLKYVEKGDNSKLNSNSETLSISQLVTIVNNAMYSDRTSRLSVYINPNGNIGGSEVLSIDSPKLQEQKDAMGLFLVDTICLDDLLPLVKAPSVYLKMDIEGSEPKALECAQKFFETVHVRFVLMEWLFQLRADQNTETTALFLIRFMSAKGFIPTTGIRQSGQEGEEAGKSFTVLEFSSWDRWPELILWIER